MSLVHPDCTRVSGVIGGSVAEADHPPRTVLHARRFARIRARRLGPYGDSPHGPFATASRPRLWSEPRHAADLHTLQSRTSVPIRAAVLNPAPALVRALGGRDRSGRPPPAATGSRHGSHPSGWLPQPRAKPRVSHPWPPGNDGWESVTQPSPRGCSTSAGHARVSRTRCATPAALMHADPDGTQSRQNQELSTRRDRG